MEIRDVNGKLRVEGYVCITDKKSRVINEQGNKYVETVEPKCFANALRKGNNVKFLLNHDSNKCLGSLDAGNVILTEDNIGLKITADIENKEVNKIKETIGFSGFSYGFICEKDELEYWKPGIKLRTLKDIKLVEVSLLDSNIVPAYYGTTVNVNNLGDSKTEVRYLLTSKAEELARLKRFAKIIELCLDVL